MEEKYSRSGKTWTDMEQWQLKELFVEGHPLDYIAESLGRPPKTVIAKLRSWKLLITVGNRVYKKVLWADFSKLPPSR